MRYPKLILAAVGVLLLSLAPLAPAVAGEPGRWVGGHSFGHFGLGAVFAHTFFGIAALPLAIVGAAAIAAQAADDRGYEPQANYGMPAYAPPPSYSAAPPAYYAAPPAVYYAPRAAYYPPAPRYYAPAVGYYARSPGYYGARPGYYASSGYQAARRPGYYHYSR